MQIKKTLCVKITVKTEKIFKKSSMKNLNYFLNMNQIYHKKNLYQLCHTKIKKRFEYKKLIMKSCTFLWVFFSFILFSDNYELNDIYF